MNCSDYGPRYRAGWGHMAGLRDRDEREARETYTLSFGPRHGPPNQCFALSCEDVEPLTLDGRIEEGG